MDLSADLVATCDVATLFGYVDDLSRYPEWMSLVSAVTPIDPTVDGPAWSVELTARVGPFARSKRLRMVRTVHEHPVRAVFERREADGRTHSPWRLTADVEEHPDGARLQMNLHYGGGLWAGEVLERVLADGVADGRDRLISRASQTR